MAQDWFKHTKIGPFVISEPSHKNGWRLLAGLCVFALAWGIAATVIAPSSNLLIYGGLTVGMVVFVVIAKRHGPKGLS
jgi:hypothetical protein